MKADTLRQTFNRRAEHDLYCFFLDAPEIDLTAKQQLMRAWKRRLAEHHQQEKAA